MNSTPKIRSTNLEPATATSGRRMRLSFSLGSMLVIMVVVAFVGAILSQLFRSVVEPTPANIGYFALAAALGPSAILIVAGTVFKVLQLLKERQADLSADAEDQASGPHSENG